MLRAHSTNLHACYYNGNDSSSPKVHRPHITSLGLTENRLVKEDKALDIETIYVPLQRFLSSATRAYDLSDISCSSRASSSVLYLVKSHIHIPLKHQPNHYPILIHPRVWEGLHLKCLFVSNHELDDNRASSGPRCWNYKKVTSTFETSLDSDLF